MDLKKNRKDFVVLSKDVGEIQYISSRRLNLGLFQKDINVTWDLAPHDISILLYLMGMRPISVSAQEDPVFLRRSTM